MISPKILLFDLGGVIVPWVGMEELSKLTGLSRENVMDIFTENNVFRAYERGHASDAYFINEFTRLFDLPKTDPAALWNSWVLPPFPQTLETLAELKSKFTLACLSNTNALHWEHLNSMFKTDEIFHFDFASHLLHEAKPDKACFIKPLEIMEAAPEDVWFFDDTMDNIETARSLGMRAFHVDRTVGVIPVLRGLGLLT